MGGNSFPARYRLANADDYKPVFDKSLRSSDAYLTVLAHQKKEGETRLGLAISRKNVRRAAARNRIKRQIRESFRLNRCRMINLDIVVMARSAASGADRKTLRASIEKHWDILKKRCDSYWCSSSKSTAT
jgi:ribonuclease P protein component